MIQIDENYQFTEDIKLLIQQENNLEEILKYCLIGSNMDREYNMWLFVLSPFKLTKNIDPNRFVPDYENYYYIEPATNASSTQFLYLEISKQFPYTIKIKKYEE